MQDFTLPATGNKEFKFSEARGRKLLVYFYPRDDTPGCTVEGTDFRHLYPEFQSLHCDIVGVSRDSIRSHESFKAKLDLPFDLLSDEEGTVCNLFAVMKMKNLYGKEVQGIDRSTFLFDEDGNLLQEWRGVKSAGHAQVVLDTLKSR